MTSHLIRISAATLLTASCVFAQDVDPFPQPINATADVVRVGITDFASLPAIGTEAARMMLLVNEPGTRRLFVNDMRGPLYSVSYDGSKGVHTAVRSVQLLQRSIKQLDPGAIPAAVLR